MTKQQIIDALTNELKHQHELYSTYMELEVGAPEKSYHSGFIDGLATAIDYVNTLKENT